MADLHPMLFNVCGPCREGTYTEKFVDGCALCKVARAYVDDLHSEPPKPARSRDEMVGASTEAVIAIRRGYGYHSAPQGIAEAVLIAAGAIAREDDDDA